MLAKEFDETGVTAEPEVIHGHPADVLVRRSDHTDLLVLGSRGHSPLANLLLGFTADHCARHALCPTMLGRAS
ncbi:MULTISPECIES: universal stress protein [unclassified Amycolatopsis]|uniref:universal stress protein n=1 Tax=unclassified Amycolatopsis TaxID=2618356 RepID=UPI001C6963B6|nr:universal stress protein [Amycolatopsis sp. DSM 110486]QYN20346.1 universal stress protein [Amycolatopsis sp. DSM 110486]